MQGNVNLPGQAIIESLLCLSFQRWKSKDNHNSAHKACLNIVIIH